MSYSILQASAWIFRRRICDKCMKAKPKNEVTHEIEFRNHPRYLCDDCHKEVIK